MFAVLGLGAVLVGAILITLVRSGVGGGILGVIFTVCTLVAVGAGLLFLVTLVVSSNAYTANEAELSSYLGPSFIVCAVSSLLAFLSQKAMLSGS